jgi:putative ABC transport system permease protein
MIKNYLIIALRMLKRNKLFSFINISGLAIGMTAFILIMLWVKDELSYDRFHDNADQMCRLISYTDQGGKNFKAAVGPAPIGKYLMENIPEIINYTTFRPYTDNMLVSFDPDDSTSNTQSFYESKRIFVDSNFFDVFSFKLKSGNHAQLMKDPHSIVISESIAQKYFENTDPIGHTLRLFDRVNFVIVGVCMDVPENSHLKFDFVIPFEILEQWGAGTGWGNFYFNNYFVLEKDANIDTVSAKIQQVMTDFFGEEASIGFYLQPLTDIHLRSNMDIDLADSESEISNDVYYFTIIAFFILLIACINFINLTTAKAAGRAKEVGLRKVIGATRGQLVRQLIGETVIYSLLALVVSLILIEFLLPVFNEFTFKNLVLFTSNPGDNILILLFLVIFTGIIAGIYPAFYLSSFQSATILKGNYSKKGGAAGIRKLLFIIQISISVLLIIATLVVKDQLNLVNSTNLGFNRENLIHVPDRNDFLSDYEGLRSMLLSDPAITDVSISSDIPTTTIHLWGNTNWEGKDDTNEKLLYFYTTSYDFQKTMQLSIKEGRFFESSSDSNNYVVNESAVSHMGMEDPVGKWFQQGEQRGKIIGVIEDFHFKSLREVVEPLVIRTGDYFHYLIIRHENGAEKRAIDKLREAWEYYNPGFPFEYQSLTQDLEDLYIKEQRTETLYSTFTFLAIFISCLGLFGLAAFTIEKRTREIAIRKVMGAEASNLIVSLSASFLKLGILANIIIWPLAWYLMNTWLQNFTYRVNVNFLFFGYGLIITIIIIMLTIAYHLFRVMRTSPVEALKNE